MKGLFRKLCGSPQFARRVGVALIFVGTLILCFIPVVDAAWLAFPASAVLIAGIVILSKYWRCPKCGRALPIKNVGRIDFCPYCGGEIF